MASAREGTEPSGDVEPADADVDHHMSGLESLMWALESDPQLSSAFANLTMFDRAPDRRIFRTRMEDATHAVPRLRERVVVGRNPLEHPEWVQDPEFDLDHHLRWVDLGGDAEIAELHHLAARLAAQPFDLQRPLWEFVTIEGLRDGRAAMLQRLHHTITDGEGGIRLSVEFLDLERHPGPRPAPRAPEGAPERTTRPRAAEAEVDPVDGSVDEQRPWWRRPLDVVGAVGEFGASVPRRGIDATSMARSTLRQATVGSHRSQLWEGRSLRRSLSTAALSLQDVRSAAHELGGSINDLFVTGAADAAGRVHRLAGQPVDELRVSIPISTRQDRSAGGNSFSPTQTLVPTGEMDPVERFTRISDILTEVKGDRAFDAVETAANAAVLLPSAAVRRTGRHLTASVDFVCSNVRAAPFDLFLGGAFMEANYPMGPLAGTAFNLTTMSYRGWMFLGLLADPAAVDDVAELLAQIMASYDELLAAGGVVAPERFELPAGA